MTDLTHHGDRDLADGLADLAVNVRRSAPPDWLARVINRSTADLGAYPDDRDALEAIAAAHALTVEEVLPTAGGAEAFSLLARARPWRRPLVVHPQFTEPEAALLAADHRPDRLLLRAEDGFRLDPDLVPDDADLVFVGNPTNPTSVLHRAGDLATLVRPGRVLVVDEAFMDAVPGESESLIRTEMAGLVVLRSLTKTWGLAGLRAGYAVGDPTVITDLRAQQPPWPVSTPALAAVRACLTPEARWLAAEDLPGLAEQREHLVAGLASVGLAVVPDPQAPFVLVDTAPVRGEHDPGRLRLGLREHGFAVRRGETFPGLGPDWIRIAVREPAVTDRLVDALHRLLASTSTPA